MSSVVWFGGICGILLKKIKRWVGNSDKGKSAARASSLMWMA